ncbi:MAG: GIY-YIG nuclease family protein [Phycisphaerales bacterium]
MIAVGKTFQIYCPAGEPRGVRIAEITTRIVQAVVVPRAKLESALQRPELESVGLYFLFGESERGGLQVVYIGEAENCAIRLKDHHRRKDFWNVAVCIVSRTGSFTKAHCKMLEWMAIDRTSRAGRYELANGNSGGQPNVPEWMQADVHEIFETAEVLLATLGFPVFEPAVHAPSDGDDVSVFACKRGGADARGIYNEEGFVVLAGSICRSEVSPSASEGVVRKRSELLEQGVVEQTAAGLLFRRDVPFASPSAAAAVVTGSSANGWTEWKNATGQTLDEVYRRSD